MINVIENSNQFFIHSYVAAKIENKEKVEEKITMGLKMNFSNYGLMVGLNLGLDNVRNHEETAMNAKKCEKVIKCKKKGISNLRYKEGLLFE